MLSVILPRTDEPKVVQFTQEALQRELSSVMGAELLVCDSWEEGVKRARNIFVCLVEPDCVVSSGYFASNVSLFKKNPAFKKLGAMASSTGVNYFARRIFGYEVGRDTQESALDGKPLIITTPAIVPVGEKRSSEIYPVQVGFVPGAIIRRNILIEALKQMNKFEKQNLVKLSVEISFFMWAANRRVHINPNTTYVSTDESVGDIQGFKFKVPQIAAGYFEREMHG